MLVREIFHTYGKKRFPQLYPCGIDCFDFANTLYDLFLVPAVYLYHKSQQKITFREYLPVFLETNSANTNSHKLLENHIGLLQKKIEYWQEKANLASFEGLGDMHQCVYKVKAKNRVWYENVLDIESLISKIPDLLPWTSEFFPNFVINHNFISREYLQSNQGDVDPVAYYYNFGKIMALCLYFRVIDIHMENVLTTKSSPFLFDIEFMLTPNISYFPFDIKLTGLVSGQTADNNTALLGGLYDIKSYLKPVLVENNPYNPSIDWIVKSKGKWKNLPLKGGHPYMFLEHIVRGYREAGADLIKLTPEISMLLKSSNFKTRILARTTRLYRYINLSYIFPQIKTKNPKTYFYNKLNTTHTSGFFKPVKKMLIDYESEQLSSFAIPYFTSEIHENKVNASDGALVGRMMETPYENWVFHAKLFPSFILHQEKQIIKVLKNNYIKYRGINKSV